MFFFAPFGTLQGDNSTTDEWSLTSLDQYYAFSLHHYQLLGKIIIIVLRFVENCSQLIPKEFLARSRRHIYRLLNFNAAKSSN